MDTQEFLIHQTHMELLPARVPPFVFSFPIPGSQTVTGENIPQIHFIFEPLPLPTELLLLPSLDTLPHTNSKPLFSSM